MLPRRQFLITGAALSAIPALHTSSPAQDEPAKETVRIGVMGLSRGQSLALDLAKLPEVEIAYLCDIDQQRLDSGCKQFQERTGKSPQAASDFREILDDPRVDALVCAAPNHWHGPATIMGCKAGKHVYVEKPCSHNPQEGEWMVAAAEQFQRCVQVGTQRRSAAGTQAAMQRLHAGAIGKVHFARCYYNNLRPSIGHAEPSEPPERLDYDLWQGPAPRVPYRSNVIHYNWHWFWHWGGGELANNGVHALDLCRWGLQVDYPTQVISAGGRYWHDDDQETPDTQTACFEFESGKQITWEALSCNTHGVDYICAFHGEEGSLELDSNGTFRIYDRNNKQTEDVAGNSSGQLEHLTNFVDCVRANDASALNLPILEGHKSTLLCHLGNIAYRTRQAVICNPENGQILGNAAQQALWQRDYDPAWNDAVRM